MTEIYDGYFERRHRSTLLPDITNLPPCLLQLVSLLRHCAATKHPLLSNGAGKHFVSELLSLSSVVGEQWVVRSSTSNQGTDWCGVVPGANEPNITGVVDVFLQTVVGQTLLVAEVKSRVDTHTQRDRYIHTHTH